MISKERKAFRDADFNSNTDPKTIEYRVGQKFDDAGLPDTYMADPGVEDDPYDDRDGRGLPTPSLSVSTEVADKTVTEQKPVEKSLANAK